MTLTSPNKVFRAFGVGAALMAVYLAVAGHWLLGLTEGDHDTKPTWEGVEHQSVGLAWLSVLLFFVVPAALPVVGYFWATKWLSLRTLTYGPVPGPGITYLPTSIRAMCGYSQRTGSGSVAHSGQSNPFQASRSRARCS